MLLDLEVVVVGVEGGRYGIQVVVVVLELTCKNEFGAAFGVALPSVGCGLLTHKSICIVSL